MCDPSCPFRCPSCSTSTLFLKGRKWMFIDHNDHIKSRLATDKHTFLVPMRRRLLDWFDFCSEFISHVPRFFFQEKNNSVKKPSQILPKSPGPILYPMIQKPHFPYVPMVVAPGSSQVLLQFFRENGWPVDGRPSGVMVGSRCGCRRRRRFFFSVWENPHRDGRFQGFSIFWGFDALRFAIKKIIEDDLRFLSSPDRSLNSP